MLTEYKACTVIIYCIITSILYLDDILPFLATAIMDTLCLVAVIVVAVIVGKPLSYLKCSEIGNEAAASSKTSAYAFTRNLDSVVDQISGKVVKYVNWIGMSRAVCLETKAVWGLTIALWFVLFFPSLFSSFSSSRYMLIDIVSCSSFLPSAVCVCGGRRRGPGHRSWTVDGSISRPGRYQQPYTRSNYLLDMS